MTSAILRPLNATVLTTSTISDALDLRRPAGRDWLVEQFGTTFELDDEVFPVLLGRRPPTRFRQLLPSLLDQWLGAGWSTGNMAGFFARRAGASGLVYPSARSNPWVDVEDGAVAGSGGWCFVSYAGAPEMEISVQVSQASGPWPAVPGYEPQAGSWVREFIPVRNVEIEHRRTKRGRGSFAVRGLGAYNRALYRLSQAGTVLRSIEPEAGAEVASELSYLALFSATADVAWLATVLLRSLLGDARSRAMQQDAVARAGSAQERVTLAAAGVLIDKAPAGFRASGAFAEAFDIS